MLRVVFCSVQEIVGLNPKVYPPSKVKPKNGVTFYMTPIH